MNQSKYSLYPIRKPRLYKAYEIQRDMFWTKKDYDLSKDYQQFLTVDEGTQHFTKYTLAFFAQSDSIVNENLALRFYKDVEEPEARMFYAAQMFIETIHTDAYADMLMTYVPDLVEQTKLFNAIETVPAVKAKAEWALKWVDSQENFIKRLIAFAIVEGIFFSGSFCSIFWLREKALFKGLTTANNLIARDEGLHWQFGALLKQELKLEIDFAEVKPIFTEAVEIEKYFVTQALPVDLIGMNSKLMQQYIEYVADIVLTSFGFPKIYNAKLPFDFMLKNDLKGKSNFFENQVSEYQISDNSFSLDADF